MSATTEEIARRLHERGDLHLSVEEDQGRIVLSGLVGSEQDREAAYDIAARVVRREQITDQIEVTDALPGEIGEVELDEAAAGGFQGAEPDLSEDDQAAEAGDFTDQETITDPLMAGGPSMSQGDVVSEGDDTYVPPTDPVGTDDEIIGGLQTSSTDSVEVERSSDGDLGDEAIRDAVMRELREDAMTTSLAIDVEVLHGRTVLRGQVPLLEDAESAQEVAARVPGVIEVLEQLEVEQN